jgi:hypothetical protein
MTRKAFVADIAMAAEKSINGVSAVVKGDDDGDVNFCFIPASGVPIEIGLLAMGMFSILYFACLWKSSRCQILFPSSSSPAVVSYSAAVSPLCVDHSLVLLQS